MNSLITVHVDREHELNNMLRGISQGSATPDEIIIVNMGEQPKIYNDYGLNINIKRIEGDLASRIPVGCARNLGAQFASHDNLHFLDVDCIPEEDYFEKMNFFLDTCKGLIMGAPRYLYNPAIKEFKISDLYKVSKHHYKRPRIKGVERITDADLFWCLCFSVKKSILDQLGGFDGEYYGHGAEDTDLGFTSLKLGIPLYLSEAVAYHQHKGFFEPPVDMIEPIILNCNRFHSKWKSWPMNKQLKAFSQQGFIQWNPDQQEPIQLEKKPGAFQSDQFYIHDMPYA